MADEGTGKYTDPEWGLKFDSKEEFAHFKRSRRAMMGWWQFAVKHIFPEEAYAHLRGPSYKEDEPLGRGKIGPWGFALRYSAIDRWHMEQRIKTGKVTKDEVLNITAIWRKHCTQDIPFTDEELLDLYRIMREENKKTSPGSKERKAQRATRKRRLKGYEQQWQSERNPAYVYRQLRQGIPNLSPMDEQVLKQLARLMANANDFIWQAEELKDEAGKVSEENIGVFSNLSNLYLKVHKEVLSMMKNHGYDYQARRMRREAQTAADVFDEHAAECEILFNEMAIEMVCDECHLNLGYFIRHFPTVAYGFGVECPRCGEKYEGELEALPDEVLGI